MSVSHIETPHGRTDAYVMGNMIIPGELGVNLDRFDHPEAYVDPDAGPVVDTVLEVKSGLVGQRVGGIAVLSVQS